MERKNCFFVFRNYPDSFLFLWAKEEPAWCLLSFEINIFLAFVMAGLGSIGEKLNKKEKQFLYTIGLYYSLFTLIFLYSLMPIFMIEYKNIDSSYYRLDK